MSLLKKVRNPFESGTPRIIIMLFLWINPVKCMKFDIFVERQHNPFQEVDLIQWTHQKLLSGEVKNRRARRK